MRGSESTKAIIESMEKSRNSLAITTVSLFELLAPIYHRKLWPEERTARAFAQRSVMLALDPTVASEASKIMGSLLRLGKPINALDVLISGIAIANGAEKIVTSDPDLREVEKVTDIQIQLL